MGRNNRQRRAAKQKARARRGPTPRRERSPAEEFDEVLDDLQDMFGGLFEPPGADWMPEAAPSPPSVLERAERMLDDWLAAAQQLSADGALREWIDRRLWSIEERVLDRADELLGHRLLADVAGLWNAGWQPRDLLHVAQRIDRRAAALAGDLSIEQLRRSGRLELAPDGWREQLESAALRARDAGLPVGAAAAWAPLDRLRWSGARSAEAVTSTLRLLVRIERLPRLTMTLPPPSAWRSAPAKPRAATAAPAASTSEGRREKVLSKIRALLAKAESTEHAAEAEILTAKAQDLMTRHAIDEALLRAGSEDAIAVCSRRVMIDSPYPFEKVGLLNEVAAANRVRSIWMEDLAMSTLVGTPVDVDQVELLFVSLLIQATRAMAEAGAGRAGWFDRSPSFRRAFLTSYAIRIGERLAEADRVATSSYGSELVPIMRRQTEAVDAEFDRLFPHTYQDGKRRSYNRRGWEAGRSAADDAVFVAGRLTG